jgi:hypothetical protein
MLLLIIQASLLIALIASAGINIYAMQKIDDATEDEDRKWRNKAKYR